MVGGTLHPAEVDRACLRVHMHLVERLRMERANLVLLFYDIEDYSVLQSYILQVLSHLRRAFHLSVSHVPALLCILGG